MMLAGTLPVIRGIVIFPAQILAGLCAGGLVSAMFPGDIADTNTTLSPGTSITQGLFIEMFMTAELVFVVLMLASEKSKGTFIAPVGIGLSLFVAMMGGMFLTSLLSTIIPYNHHSPSFPPPKFTPNKTTGVYYTGGSLNPARSFGPAIASTQFPGYHWIYWVGPFLGGALSAAYFRLVKYFHYEQVNPGQEGDFFGV